MWKILLGKTKESLKYCNEKGLGEEAVEIYEKYVDLPDIYRKSVLSKDNQVPKP